jgi:UDP-N-acetylglucosamine kinase
MAGDDRRMPNITQRVTGPWVRRAIDEALANRFSLLLEGTFRDPSTVVDTAARFAARDYRTEAVALAVRAERSRLDSVDRYYTLVARGLPGRWTPPGAHDGAYAALPDTVAAAAASPQVHQVVVTNRTGEDLFVGDAARTGRSAAARVAVVRARDTPFPRGEARQWLARLHLNVAHARQAGRIDEVSRPVLRQLVQDARVILPMAHPPGSADHGREQRRIDQLDRALRPPHPQRSAYPAKPAPGAGPTPTLRTPPTDPRQPPRRPTL